MYKDMDIQQHIKILESLIDNYQLKEAQEKVSDLLAKYPREIDFMLVQGKIQNKNQQYGDALNTYRAILAIDKDNEKAQAAINMINNILKIRRSFYFENTYTDDDLYL
jgi:predicted Zn-dependent protease